MKILEQSVRGDVPNAISGPCTNEWDLPGNRTFKCWEPVGDQRFIHLLVVVCQSGKPNTFEMTLVHYLQWPIRSSFVIRKHRLQLCWLDGLPWEPLDPTDLIHLFGSICLRIPDTVSPRFSSLGYPHPGSARLSRALPGYGLCCMPQLHGATRVAHSDQRN